MPVTRAETDLAHLKSEIARLRAQIADAEARAVKVQHYLEMARLYGAGGDAAHPVVRSRGSKAGHIVDMVREALQERGEPMTTRALVDVCIRRGIALGGNNPVNYLSGILSRADGIENDRVRGWHLTGGGTAREPHHASELAQETASDEAEPELEDQPFLMAAE